MVIIYDKNKRKCADCNNALTKRHQIRYCSNKCQLSFRHKMNVSNWKSNPNNEKYKTKNVSGYIKRYLREKYKEKCSICGWNQINPITKKVPLEVDHADGNSENNSENNLRLLCPNCHSLTPYFRNLNKGKGRAWRLKKI